MTKEPNQALQPTVGRDPSRKKTRKRIEPVRASPVRHPGAGNHRSPRSGLYSCPSPRSFREVAAPDAGLRRPRSAFTI